MNPDKLEINNRKLDAAQPADKRPETSSGREQREQYEQYAAALALHFQTYVAWASDHWPAYERPLDPASFNGSLQDLNAIFAQLGLPGPNSAADPGVPGAVQFVPVTPMPWP
ncbi:MAG: hypothetical protein JWQ10_167 [Herbaspirillum sp.]|nr:hypothetical protein [Herbaspirillum sp.]